MANQTRATNLFFGERVDITVPNYTVSIPTVRYQYLLTYFLHAFNNNFIILIESL